MRSPYARVPVVFAGLLAGLAVAASPAHAALDCAPDPFEKDVPGSGAPLAAGNVTTRAICQAPTSEPRTESARDEDFFVFTATGSTAYTVEAVDVGAALVNDEFDRGGLELGVARLNAEGTTTPVQQNRRLNGDRVITPVLDAGSYVVRAFTADTQIYPETNAMDVKTVQGRDGVYGVRLTESDPAPVVTSLSLSSTTVRGGESVTGAYTLSAPAPPGGMAVDVRSSDLNLAWPGGAHAPAGATRVSFSLATIRVTRDHEVRIIVSARVGPSIGAVLRLRR